MIPRYYRLIVIFFLYFDFSYLGEFSRLLDCGITQGCPIDPPHFVVSLKSAFGVTNCRSAPKVVLCAFLCQLNKECISFNQLLSDECQMFRTVPYRISAGSNCNLFRISSGTKCKNATNGTNLALNRPTCQSSTYLESGHPLYSWLAVDGLNGTDPLRFQCSHTIAFPKLTSWFMVELLAISKVVKVRILVRYVPKINRYTGDRIRNLTIRATNESWPLDQVAIIGYSLCGIYDGPVVSAVWINVDCSPRISPAKFIVVHPGIPDGNLCLCEIEVYGYNFGYC